MYQERRYRDWIREDDLLRQEVRVGETDLLILAEGDLRKEAICAVKEARRQIEEYIKEDPSFASSLTPIKVREDAPFLIKEMALSALSCKVGPMAAVAGAISEYVGRRLLPYSKEVIVENGGDIFMATSRPRKIGIYAGSSTFTGSLSLKVEPGQTPLSICTSSGTVGHSLSFGKSDAVVVLSKNGALADAAATRIGNAIKEKKDIDRGIKLAKKIKGIEGVLIIVSDSLGVFGDVKLG